MKSKNEIQRYTVTGDIAYPIHEDSEGAYVYYDDYAESIRGMQEDLKLFDFLCKAAREGRIVSLTAVDSGGDLRAALRAAMENEKQ